MTDPSGPSGYAVGLAEESYQRYSRHAAQARHAYRLSEILFLVFSAGIPVAAVLWPDTAQIPALLGGALVLLTGLRNVYHWHDNYVRFSRARESVNAERRYHAAGLEPYEDPATRDQQLVAAVTRIEQEEMGQWVRVITQRPRPDPPTPT